MAKKQEEVVTIQKEKTELDKNLEKFFVDVDKKYGKGTVVKMDGSNIQQVKRCSSGSIGLDLALGGGYPEGTIMEIYGPESSGKSTICIHAIAEKQKEGGICGYIDAEHSFDPYYAANLGVDIDSMIFHQPENGEQALGILEDMINSKAFSLVIVDSVTALVPKAIIEGEMGESKMGLHARLMSQALSKITARASNNKCTILFTNQLRDKIGVMYGSPEVTTGGNALKFWASIRMDIRRIGQNKDGEEVISNQVRVKVVKNKTFPPFRKAEFDIVFGEGIDTIAELVELGVQFEIIKKSGSWYSYGEVKLGQGAEGVKTLMLDNPELLEEVKTKILNKLNN